MKVPLSWLKEFLDLEASAEEIARILTGGGIEVDEVKVVGQGFSGVVTATVVGCIPHPNADRLQIATVSDGTEMFQVVCGAKNCRVGLKTAFARVGAVLPQIKIKKSRIREIDSFGMLCAADELGVGSGEGIIELPGEIADGLDLGKLYGDVVFEIGLTPNLGHCLSVLGIARELSALMGIELKKRPVVVEEVGEDRISVEILAPKACPRYGCRSVREVKVGPSPLWMKHRLELSGVRSINNVVDVGNYVMLETGQPLHMFDLGKVSKIIVAQRPDDVVVISNGTEVMAYGGVMGEEAYWVSDETREVLIEAAYFSPQAIRKSSKVLGIRSESSARFERGVDPNGIAHALDRASQLLEECAGGKATRGMVIKASGKFERKKIGCRISRVNGILGTTLSLGEAAGLLRRLEMGVHEEGVGMLQVEVPTYRHDLLGEIDLIEEIGRVYGYGNIPKASPRTASSTVQNDPMELLEKEVRERMVAEGLQELITCDLISPEQAQLSVEHGMEAASHIAVLHPSSIDQSVLRTSLLPGLLQVMKYNWDHQNSDVSGFEVGRIHFWAGEKVVEQEVVGIVLMGKRAPYHWDPKVGDVDFFDLKGIVQNLLEGLHVEGAGFIPSHLHHLHPGRQARIEVGGALIGTLGEIHPNLDLPQKIYFAEINLTALTKSDWKLEPLAEFPGSDRDLTLTVSEEVPFEGILEVCYDVDAPLLRNVSLLDLYRGPHVGEGKKNITLRFFYRDLGKTLDYESVETEHARVVNAVKLYVNPVDQL